MKRTTPGLLVLLLAGACVHGSNFERVRAGMSESEVVSIMGAPESSTHAPGRECSVYTVLKDFWSRVPWDMSNRYIVCYTDGRVETFGRADQPEVRTSLRQ